MKVAGKISTIEIALLAMAAVFLVGTGVQYAGTAAELSSREYVVTTGRQADGEVSPEVPEEVEPVDINSADLELLQTLPGIGPVLAQRIIDYRTEHGPFTSVEQLLEINGIGEATLAEVRGGVTINHTEKQAAGLPAEETNT